MKTKKQIEDEIKQLKEWISNHTNELGCLYCDAMKNKIIALKWVLEK